MIMGSVSNSFFIKARTSSIVFLEMLDVLMYFLTVSREMSRSSAEVLLPISAV